MNNPLTDAYDQIYAMLKAHPAVISFLDLTNHPSRFPSYHFPGKTYWPDPLPSSLESIQYPMARLLFRPQWRYNHPDGPHIYSSSDDSELTALYALEVLTGQQIQNRVLDCVWSIYQASTNWYTYLRQGVSWNGKQCVVRAEPTQLDVNELDTEREKERARGTNQWEAVFCFSVLFSFTTADLQTNAGG